MSLASIYKKNTWSKPTSLVHYTHNEDLATTGMAPIANWSQIDQLVNRPTGIFFWNEEDKKDTFCSGVFELVVQVADLDTSKLFAYPVAISDAAEQLSHLRDDERKEHSELLASMAAVEAMPYDDYDGTFFAEWIYTGEIAASVITIME